MWLELDFKIVLLRPLLNSEVMIFRQILLQNVKKTLKVSSNFIFTQ